MGNPTTGVIFHSGGGEHMDLEKLAQRVIRPVVEPSDWSGMAPSNRYPASMLSTPTATQPARKKSAMP